MSLKKIFNKRLNQSLINIALPYLPDMMPQLREMALDYKQTIALEEGETHVGGVIIEDYGQLFIVVSAFKDQTITRKIKVIKESDILNFLSNGIPNS